MVSDSIVNANSPKDIGKKKRANRASKLKQCKRDARRVQWLSQVNIKGVKEEVSSGDGNGGSGEFNGRAIETRKAVSIPPCCKAVQVRSVSVEEIHNHDSDSESSSLTYSPTSCLTGEGNRYGGSSSSSSSGSSRASSSSFGSGGCCSGSMTEEEEEEATGVKFGGGDDDGCLDDWEAVADALLDAVTSAKQGTEDDSDRTVEKEAIFRSDSESAARTKDHNGHACAQTEKGKSENVEILGMGGASTRAWRSDDAFRPQSLPNLSKQRSFPANPERLSWARNNMPLRVPSSCPICCEDLDVTDSSFLPCPCGFHLCLFCHKRIIEGDGRCPGCRKPYASEVAEKETTVSGGSLTIRLARSSSMLSRV